jgi:ATPase subunit of ABC transporter with duplicated ATPase domains
MLNSDQMPPLYQNTAVQEDPNAILSGKEKRALAKQAKRDKKKAPTEGNVAAPAAHENYIIIQQKGLAEVDELDDFSSAWAHAKEIGKWGGRGMGGRAVNRNQVGLYDQKTTDCLVENVTLAFQGKELLTPSKLQLVWGRSYGLVGGNGVGKSTLLRRLGNQSIPGMPVHLTSYYVQQESIVVPGQSVMDCILQANQERCRIETRIAKLQEEESTVESAAEIECLVDRLAQMELEDEQNNTSPDKRARTILKGLQFTKHMMEGPVANLSGGWRMRLALASALFASPDLLLLDEPTNHLDLYGVLWLQNYLTTLHREGIVVIISHDEEFLKSVVTDVIVFAHKTLSYFPGGYELFLKNCEEKQKWNTSKNDAIDRKKKQMHDFIAMQQSLSKSKKGNDPNKQRQAKERKHKLGEGDGYRKGGADRLTMFRSDGKKFKTVAGHVPPEKLVRFKNEPTICFRFPEPKGRVMGAQDKVLPLIALHDVHFSYNAEPITSTRTTTCTRRRALSAQSTESREGKTSTAFGLQNINAQIDMSSRLVIVGRNGAGKSTLIKMLMNEFNPTSGTIKRDPHLRVGYVMQNHMQLLIDHLNKSPVEFILSYMQKNGRTCTELEVRQHLGSFGIHGDLALSSLGSLSGGQKSRVVFSLVSWDSPHMLILDEPTNHLDLESIQALSLALADYSGAVVLVSHNQGFVSEFGNQLWVVENNKVRVACEAKLDFQDAFSKYVNEVKNSFT